jgi:hypothetical protein
MRGACCATEARDFSTAAADFLFLRLASAAARSNGSSFDDARSCRARIEARRDAR